MVTLNYLQVGANIYLTIIPRARVGYGRLALLKTTANIHEFCSLYVFEKQRDDDDVRVNE